MSVSTLDMIMLITTLFSPNSHWVKKQQSALERHVYQITNHGLLYPRHKNIDHIYSRSKDLKEHKGRILKRVFFREQSTPNFPKNDYFLPPDTHMYVCFLESLKIRFTTQAENALCILLCKSKNRATTEQKCNIVYKRNIVHQNC